MQKDNNEEIQFGAKLGDHSVKITGLPIATIIQTLILIFTIVALGSTSLAKLDKVSDDQDKLKVELQQLRSEMITRNEAAVQFNYINDQLKRHDEDIREIQNDMRRR